MKPWAMHRTAEHRTAEHRSPEHRTAQSDTKLIQPEAGCTTLLPAPVSPARGWVHDPSPRSGKSRSPPRPATPLRGAGGGGRYCRFHGTCASDPDVLELLPPTLTEIAPGADLLDGFQNMDLLVGVEKVGPYPVFAVSKPHLVLLYNGYKIPGGLERD